MLVSYKEADKLCPPKLESLSILEPYQTEAESDVTPKLSNGGVEFDFGQDLLPDSKYKKYSYPSNCSINVLIFSCKVASDAEMDVWSVNGFSPFIVSKSL